MRVRQSFCYPCFRPADMSLDQLCEEAARIGCVGVELWWRDDEFEELVAAARRHGLIVQSGGVAAELQRRAAGALLLGS